MSWFPVSFQQGYQKYVKDKGVEASLPGLQDYSPNQLFWISSANVSVSSFALTTKYTCVIIIQQRDHINLPVLLDLVCKDSATVSQAEDSDGSTLSSKIQVSY